MLKPLFSLDTTNKLSLDTDDGRQNNYTSIIRDNSGRLIAFYEKEWKSGRLSQSMVSATSGLGIQVAAGNGEINGVSTSWLLTSLTVPASSYSLIYVDVAGTVLQSTDITSTLVKDIIVLAFVGSGGSAVTYVDMIERVGFYLFSKRQVLTGSDWVWDDYEYRLNVGRDPTASYDSVNDKVYLTFSKDGSTYVRVIDLTDPLTWEYLSHIIIVGGTTYPDTDPQATSVLKIGAGVSSVSFGQLFPISAIGVGYRVGMSGVEQYVHVPYLNSAFNAYATDGTIYCEIFEKVGASYVLLDSFPIVKACTYTWRLFSGGYDKTIYLGVRLKHTLYVEDEFSTDPLNYDTLYVYQGLTSSELVGSAWTARCSEEIHYLEIGAGVSVSLKTSEYDQLFRSQDDYGTAKLSASSSAFTKTAEYDQLFSFTDDSTELRVGASQAVFTMTS